MLKRLVFTLLYDNGSFVLSRNFRLQRVGDVRWLKRNYHFGTVAESIDELVILDVTRGQRDLQRFCSAVRSVTEACFVPVAVGGGISSMATVEQLLLAGADKVVLNSLLVDDPGEVAAIAEVIGAQSVVASIDVRRSDDRTPWVVISQAERETGRTLFEHVQAVTSMPIGELYVNSVDQDGTGMGLDLEMVAQLGDGFSQPLILAGGVGHSQHLFEGLSLPTVSAVATANLLNFVGDGLQRARTELREQGVPLAVFGL
jgi:cyclase